MPRLAVGPAPTITTNNVAINKLNKQIGDAKEFAKTAATKIEELT
jgi:hypothetical protein